jgi:hypothetical protein
MPSDESAAIPSTARQQLEMVVAVDGDFSDGDAPLVMALHCFFTTRVNTAGAPAPSQEEASLSRGGGVLSCAASTRFFPMGCAAVTATSATWPGTVSIFANGLRKLANRGHLAANASVRLFFVLNQNRNSNVDVALEPAITIFLIDSLSCRLGRPSLQSRLGDRQLGVRRR